MGDAEGALLPSKKRFAEGQLSRDNPGLDDEDPEPELGTFKRANDEVMATRRIVKVRRHQPPASSSSNPFAGIHLVPSTESNAKPSSPDSQTQVIADKEVSEAQDGTDAKHEKTDEEKGTESEQNGKQENSKQLENKYNGSKAEDSVVDKKDAVEGETGPGEVYKEAGIEGQETAEEARAGTEEEVGEEEAEKGVQDEIENIDDGQKDKAEPAAPLSSFQQLSSSQNAFTGLAGTGFSSSSFSFGSLSKEGSSFGTSSGSIFGLRNENPSYPSFSLGSSNNGSSSVPLFSATGKDASRSGGSCPSMQEVPVETGEENEKAVFNADAILFEYLDGGWKERGKGELKVNVSTSGAERARLVMRARGNYRLILNASIYPDMSLTNMEKRGVTFACVNSSAGEGKGGLVTFALKFKDASVVEEFHGAVAPYKGKKTTSLKTPENSPKASDD